jgi:hypothetical protein
MDRSAQKVFIEPMKDLGFGRMRENDVAIMVIQIFDLIFLKAARRAKVEVAGVLITEDAVFYFRPLSLVCRFIGDPLAEVLFHKRAKAKLQDRQVPKLFKLVKEGDDSATVDEVDVWELARPGPSPSFRSDPFELKAEASHRGEVGVAWADTIPVGSNERSKRGVPEPGILQTKNGAPRCFRGGSQMEGHMVRGGSGRGGEGRVRERQTPLGVYEDPIEAGKDRGGLLVGPSELAVEERDFHQPKGVDKVVEHGCLNRVEIAIRLIPGGPGEIKVSQKGDRSREGGKNLGQRGKEGLFLVVVARAINIHNGEGEIIGLPGEGGRDREVIDGVVEELEVPVIPGSENASGSADGRFKDEGAERRRKEGGGKEG